MQLVGGRPGYRPCAGQSSGYTIPSSPRKNTHFWPCSSILRRGYARPQFPQGGSLGGKSLSENSLSIVFMRISFKLERRKKKEGSEWVCFNIYAEQDKGKEPGRLGKWSFARHLIDQGERDPGVNAHFSRRAQLLRLKLATTDKSTSFQVCNWIQQSVQSCGSTGVMISKVPLCFDDGPKVSGMAR